MVEGETRLFNRYVHAGVYEREVLVDKDKVKIRLG